MRLHMVDLVVAVDDGERATKAWEDMLANAAMNRDKL